MNRLSALIGAMALGTALTTSVAHADREAAAMLEEAKISLTEAIAIAEQHEGGVAFEAKLDDDSFAPEYEVDVFVDGRVFEVTVDAVSGEVRRVREDRDD